MLVCASVLSAPDPQEQIVRDRVRGAGEQGSTAGITKDVLAVAKILTLVLAVVILLGVYNVFKVGFYSCTKSTHAIDGRK